MNEHKSGSVNVVYPISLLVYAHKCLIYCWETVRKRVIPDVTKRELRIRFVVGLSYKVH